MCDKIIKIEEEEYLKLNYEACNQFKQENELIQQDRRLSLL